MGHSLPRSLDQLPPRHREEALRQLGRSEPNPDLVKLRSLSSSGYHAHDSTSGHDLPGHIPAKSGKRVKGPIRIRQDHSPKMNKLESEWFETIRHLYPNYTPVRCHAKTYVLANGVRYTPDFSASCWPDVESDKSGPSRETCWEVKGPRAWDDALVKIKVAAHEWPEIRWLFVWKEGGVWQQQEIIP